MGEITAAVLEAHEAEQASAADEVKIDAYIDYMGSYR